MSFHRDYVAMVEEKRYALAQVVLHGREQLALLRPQENLLVLEVLPSGRAAQFFPKPHHVNSNPESQRVSGYIFGLKKGPSELGHHLLNHRESNLKQKCPKNAGNSPRAGTKFPVSSVNSKAR